MSQLEEPLSERELDVLEQLMSGASNKEIAAILTISPNTVKVHLRNIYSKLNVSSRTEASMAAIELGLFAPPGEAEPAPPEPDTEPEVTTAEEISSEVVAAEPPTAVFAPEEKPEPMLAPMLDLEPVAPQRNWRVWIGGFVAVALVLALGGWWLSQATTVGAPLVSSTTDPLDNVPPIATPFTETELSEARWYRSRALPLSLTDLAVVSSGLNLYQIGGITAEGETTPQVHVYNTSLREWQQVADKPTPISDTSAAVLLEIYVPGGRNSDGDPVSTVEAYSPLNNFWRQVADLPQPLAGSLTLANSQGIYLFGGWNGSEFVADSYLYDPVSDSWRPLPPLREARARAVGGLIDGRFYVVGGENETGALASCEVFDPATESWEVCPALTAPRSGGGAAVVLNNLYVIGGTGSETEGFSEVFSPSDQVWRIVNHPQEETESVGWQNPAVVSVETRIYVLGGSSAQNFVYLPPVYQTFIPAVGGNEP
ncbi:MAG: hypothetical protein KDD89_00195 [Anaerolineales bacterium]|nr:hypothetical protein [Anaerolineales bacterium]